MNTLILLLALADLQPVDEMRGDPELGELVALEAGELRMADHYLRLAAAVLGRAELAQAHLAHPDRQIGWGLGRFHVLSSLRCACLQQFRQSRFRRGVRDE